MINEIRPSEAEQRIAQAAKSAPVRLCPVPNAQCPLPSAAATLALPFYGRVLVAIGQ